MPTRSSGDLTGRHYGLITEYKTEDADTVFVSLGCAAENIEEACDYLREQRNAKVGSIHVNVIRPFPEAAVIEALRGKKNVIILERTDEGMAGDNPLGRDIRIALGKAQRGSPAFGAGTLPALTPGGDPAPRSAAPTASARAISGPSTRSAPTSSPPARPPARTAGPPATARPIFTLGVDHPYAVISQGHAVAAARRAPSRCASTRSAAGA